jgi:hypothetical protein
MYKKEKAASLLPNPPTNQNEILILINYMVLM